MLADHSSLAYSKLVGIVRLFRNPKGYQYGDWTYQWSVRTMRMILVWRLHVPMECSYNASKIKIMSKDFCGPCRSWTPPRGGRAPPRSGSGSSPRSPS